MDYLEHSLSICFAGGQTFHSSSSTEYAFLLVTAANLDVHRVTPIKIIITCEQQADTKRNFVYGKILKTVG